MIELQVKPYCHDCDEFEPVKESLLMVYSMNCVERTTIVKCEHANRCERIKKYLEKDK